jgi:hypothetical protein
MNKVMIKLIFSLLILNILNSCIGIKKPPISCSQLVDKFNSYPSKTVILDTAKGYMSLTKDIYLRDKVVEFSSKIKIFFLYLELLEVKEIENPFISKYCRDTNFIIKDTNQSRLITKLERLREQWTEDYAYKKMDIKIEFNEINACKTIAKKLQNISLNDVKSKENYFNMQERYFECLQSSKIEEYVQELFMSP